jgi:hypothetical protein
LEVAVKSKLCLLLTILFMVTTVTAALAVPTKLSQQGRLLDGDGDPLTGTHALIFSIYDAETGGNEVWREERSVDFEEGYYAVVLGELVPVDDLLFSAGAVWLELTVNGAVLSPRQEIVSVPWALRATSAEHVDGGVVEAAEISVGGVPVIDSTGAWVGPTPSVDWTELTGVPGEIADGDQDTDTLADLALSCANGEVARFQDPPGTWSCAAETVTTTLPWSAITGVPGDIADGDQDTDSLADLGQLCANGDRPAWDAAQSQWTCASEQVGLDRLDSATAAAGQVMTFDGTSISWEDPASSNNPACTLVVLHDSFGFAGIQCGATPVGLRTWMPFTQVGAGYIHSCGLAGSGAVRCWGSDASGQSSPPAGTFTQISVGGHHNCGINSGGTVQCWGNNDYGQAIPPAGAFTQVSAGGTLTCGVTGGGALQCWGVDDGGGADAGQVTGTPTGAFTQVSAGAMHACAIDGSGQVQCWGGDLSGQSTPPAGTFTQISSGGISGSHTCGIDTTGSVQCWGANNLGQSTPPAGTFTQISTGADHTCGIDTTGSVQCWGDNSQGESSAPQVGSFTQVAAGNHYTCAILQTFGAAICWGSDVWGQSTPP